MQREFIISGNPDLENCYLCSTSSEKYALYPYAKGFLCWRQEKDDKMFKPFIPFFPFFDENGESIKDSQFYTNTDDEKQVVEFVNSIPKEIKKLTYSIENFQWIAVETIFRDKNFFDFLQQEYQTNKFSYITSIFILTEIISQPLSKRIAVYQDIIEKKRDILLSSLMDLPCDKKFFSLINKFSASELDKEIIGILYYFSQNNKVYPILSECLFLKRSFLNFIYYKIPDWLLIPSLVKILVTNQKSLNFNSQLFPELILQAEQKHHYSITMSLKSAEDLNDLNLKIEKLTKKILSLKEFPSPPFKGTDLLVPITSGKDLIKEGKRMQSCVEDYIKYVIECKSYFYHWYGKKENIGLKIFANEEATVQLDKTKNGVWKVTEYLGFKNSHLDSKNKAELLKETTKMFLNGEMTIEICNIAGLYYYKATELWNELSPKSSLVLIREPQNLYDRNAVAVYYDKYGTIKSGASTPAQRENLKLGYIPSIFSKKISFLMDNKQQIFAKILDRYEIDNYKTVSIKISFCKK